MLVDTEIDQVVNLMEEIFDNERDKAEAVATFNIRIKDAKDTLVSFAEEHDVDPKALMQIYDQYKKSRNGKITWTEEDQEYSGLLFEVMERAIKNNN